MHQILQQKHRHHGPPPSSDSHHQLIESPHESEEKGGSGITSQLLCSVAAPAQILLKSQTSSARQSETALDVAGLVTGDGGLSSGRCEDAGSVASTSRFWDNDDFKLNEKLSDGGGLNELPCLKLNVSGARYQILRARLLKYPETRLGHLAAAATRYDAERYCDCLVCDSQEYYFDRSPNAFDAVANLYRQEALHFPDNVCPYSFFEEIKYWGIDRSCVAPCCELKMHLAEMEEVKKHEAADLTRHFPKPASNGLLETGMAAKPKTAGCCTRESIWELLEQPASSKFALAFTILSVCFVFATVIILILGSMPSFRKTEIAYVGLNMTSTVSIDKVDEGLEIADAVCVAWFTFEILLRLWSCPHRLRYMRSPLCLIDFGAVLPFYVELVMSFVGIESKTFKDFRKSLLMIRILRALRVMRVLRVLKVARYSRGFQSVGATLKKSWKELLMLVMFMFTTNIIFSTVIYFIEGDDYTGSKFTSIPAASWWCIITMTTVGYGDVYPHTIGGKIVAVVVSISGIILLAFPISVIVEHFHEEYTGDAEKQEEKEEEPQMPTVPSAEAAPLALALIRANATLAQMVTSSLVLPGSNGADPLDFSNIAKIQAGAVTAAKPKKKRHRRGFKL